MPQWTDTIENSLDIIRQNVLKLGEDSLNNYNALQKRILFLRLPLAFLSAANTYAAIDLGNHISEYDVTLICSVISASIAGYLTYDWFVGSQTKLETDFSFYKDCEHVGDQISQYLAVPMNKRKRDGKDFLDEMYKRYIKLVNGHEFIIKNKETLVPDIEQLEDIEGVLIDHWNFIFRPTLRRFKSKVRESIMEQQPSLEDIGSGFLQKMQWFRLQSPQNEQIIAALIFKEEETVKKSKQNQLLIETLPETIKQETIKPETIKQEEVEIVALEDDDSENQITEGESKKSDQPLEFGDIYKVNDSSFIGSSKMLNT